MAQDVRVDTRRPARRPPAARAGASGFPGAGAGGDTTQESLMRGSTFLGAQMGSTGRNGAGN